MRQCAEMGVKPTLLTVDKLRDADWPREALEEMVTMPAGLTVEQILNTVSWMARGRRFDRIVALDEFDLETAAQIREHMRDPRHGRHRLGLLSRQAGHAHRRARLRIPGSRVLPRAQLRRAARLHGPRAARPGCSSRAPRLPHWAFARFTSRSSCGARSTSLATGRAASCWSSLSPATFFTSTRSSAKARSCFPWFTVRPAADAGDARGRGLHHPHRGPQEPRLGRADCT